MSFQATLQYSQQAPTSLLVSPLMAVRLHSSPRLVEVGDSGWDDQLLWEKRAGQGLL